MEKNREERLPAVVEESLNAAYEKIRRGEITKMRKKRAMNLRRLGAAAAVFLVLAVPSAVLAATVFFHKNVKQDADQIAYTFEINYELVPGEYQVTPRYLPEGVTDMGNGKYNGEKEEWITVMPIYTMAELDKADSQITVKGIENVEHMVLSGMEADVITFCEAQKYQSPTYIFLFNDTEGFVLEIVAGYSLDREEMLKFADNLHVERIGNDSYETESEKAARIKEEADRELLEMEGQKTWNALIQAGIPQDKIYGVGEEIISDQAGCYGYTITDYEFTESIAGFDKEHFFDYTRFEGWVNDDGTLRPYTRIRYDENGDPTAEKLTEQEILRVDLKVHCYQKEEGVEACLDLALAYVEKREDSSYTWASDWYDALPEEGCELQIDQSAVWFDKAVHTQNGERQDFFFHDMEIGEEITYTLLFVVDKDREGDFLLQTVAGNNSIQQTESMTVKEIREQLEGYIRLE